MIWLDYSRILAMCAVVFLHSAAGVVIESDLGSEYWWIGNIYDSIVRWCVPVFVMISGALLLDTTKTEPIRYFYKKRISKIFIPITFWSAFYLLWSLLKGFVRGEELLIPDILIMLLTGKPYYHMWYLYMIVPLYVFTPFFRKIIAGSSRSEILTFILFTFALAISNNIVKELNDSRPNIFTNLFLSYIPYFFLGYFIRTQAASPSKPILLFVFVLSAFLTAIGLFTISVRSGLELGLYFYGYLSITVVPMSVSIMYLLKSWEAHFSESKTTLKISGLTLGVYLIHPIFLDVITYLGLGPNSYHPAFSIPITAITIIFLSLFAAFITRRIPLIKHTI